MELKNSVYYEEWKANNADAFGRVIFRYAERWANLMENRISIGENLEDIAKETSHEADTDGITGFMYGEAVYHLVHCWQYGEQLRQWHNQKYRYAGDGVASTAVINIQGR